MRHLDTIVEYIRNHGPSTRPQIASGTGLPIRKVNRVVLSSMYDEDYLRCTNYWLRRYNECFDIAADEQYPLLNEDPSAYRLRLIGGTVGRGSHTDPGVFDLNPAWQG